MDAQTSSAILNAWDPAGQDLAITKKRDSGGSFFEGIAIRDTRDEISPRPITKDSDDANVTVVAIDCDGSVTAGTPVDDGCDGCDGLFVIDLDKTCNPGEEEETTVPPRPITENSDQVSVMGCDGSVTAGTPVDDGCDGCDGLFVIGLDKTCNSDEEQVTTVSLNSEPGANKSDENLSHPSHPSLPTDSVMAEPITQAVTVTSSTHSLPKTHHAFFKGCLRADSDPFWHQLPATEGTSIVTRKNRALQIRKAWLAAKSGDELKKLKQRWSEEAEFVWNRVLTANERNRLKALAESRQISISDIPKDDWSAEELANMKAMWDSDESFEARRSLLKVFPLAVLERAIPTLELKRVLN